jgi:hypothetical protein
LKSRFKAVCAATNNSFQNFQIRVHRSLSWLERAFATDAEQEPDGRLLFGWIAFNALYGRWDEQQGYAAKDRESWKEFACEVLRRDSGERVGLQLKALRDDVLKLLDNKFLDPQFWKDPSAKRKRRSYFAAQAHFHERRWQALTLAVLDRIYTLRGQLVHGAATRGSRLNRTSLQVSCRVLEGILVPLLEIVINQRADDNWPPLCYPPIKEESANASGLLQMPRPR